MYDPDPSRFDPAARLGVLAAEAPDRVAIVAPSHRWTYGALAVAVADAAAGLRHKGAGPGRTVELPVPGTPSAVAQLLAVHTLGATLHVRPPGHREQIRDGAADALVVVETSGSAGSPRLVPLTAANLGAAVTASQRRLGNTEDDRWLACLPLHHIGGLAIVYRSLAAGASVLLAERFDAGVVSEALAGHATFVSLVPTMLVRLLRQGSQFSGVRVALLGGAAAPASLVGAGAEARLPIATTYGLTEAASQVATVAPAEIDRSLGTVGPPLDGIEVSFDEAGQILIDGPAVFAGYGGALPRTGPHATGDRGYLDDAGHLVIEGRIDRVIVTGGESVHPEHVEAVLIAHPAVRAAIVVPREDSEWGQSVVAAVETSEATESDLRAWSRERLTRHEVPQAFLISAALPRLPSGKVDAEAVRSAVGSAGEGSAR